MENIWKLELEDNKKIIEMKSIYKILWLLLLGMTVQLQAQVATIPFELDNLMYIKVKINDNQEELNFVFDTGASTVVLDKKVAERLGVKANYQQPATGAGGTEMYDIALSQTLKVNEVTLTGKHMVLVDLETLSKRGNNRIDGIVGADILNQYVTKVDFDAKQITLYKHVEDVSDSNTYKPMDITLDFASVPEVAIDFSLGNDKTFKGNFLFDSGAALTLLLNTPFVEKNNIENIVGNTIENKAEGLTTSASYIVGNAKKVTFAGHEFTDLPIDLSKSKAGVMASPDYAGILGIKIINRFNLILDYNDEKIYFKPNQNYAKKFEFPLSGLSIVNEGDKAMIQNVIMKSEAYEKGLRKGDEVLSLNGDETRDVDAYRKLLKEEGKSVTIKVKTKSGEIKQVVIVLKRLI